jgi:hypothetical protein
VVNNLQREALKRVELISAQQVVQFSIAANAYANANANSLPAGTSITVPNLIAAGYLYSSFNTSNPVGQQLLGVVGIKNANYSTQIPVMVYYNPTYPPVLGPYKISSINVQATAAYEMHVATDVSTMQETSPSYVSGLILGPKKLCRVTGRVTACFQLPYTTNPFSISASFPGFTSKASSFANLINALPSAGY